MSSAFTSARTARLGASAKNSAAPPAKGSRYRRYVPGRSGRSCARSWPLPPAHLRNGRASGLSAASGASFRAAESRAMALARRSLRRVGQDGKISARRSLDAGEGALVRPERPALGHRGEDGQAFGLPPLREDVLDPRPAGARRADVDPAAEALAQAVERVLDGPDARERRRVERRVPLRAERRDPQRERDDA